MCDPYARDASTARSLEHLKLLVAHFLEFGADDLGGKLNASKIRNCVQT
ncbi:MAG: hypothetical protein M3460_00420 [Actinomycetota bacterium]|nr:hypothetical protein [Actinomycetota bacterium]